MRKLTKREKIILSALFLIVFSYIYIEYIIVPQRQNIAKAKVELSDAELEIEKLESYRMLVSSLEEEFEEQNRELENGLNRNFTDLKQEDIIMTLEKLADDSGLINKGVEFKKPQLEEIAGEKLELNSAELSFSGSYYVLRDFLEKLSSYDKKIIVDKIAIDREKEGLLSGVVLLNMYSLEDIAGIKTAVFNWQSDNSRASTDPFNPFSGYVEALKKPEQSPSLGPVDNESAVDPEKSEAAEKEEKSQNPESGSKPAEESEEKSISIESFSDSEKLTIAETPIGEVKAGLENKTEDSKQSVLLSYDFLKNRNYSSVTIGFKEKKEVAAPHLKISLDIKPYIANSHILRIVLKDSKNKYYDLPLTDNLNWSGWKTVTAELPNNSSFPVSIEKVYIESRNADEALLGEVFISNLRMMK